MGEKIAYAMILLGTFLLGASSSIAVLAMSQNSTGQSYGLPAEYLPSEPYQSNISINDIPNSGITSRQSSSENEYNSANSDTKSEIPQYSPAKPSYSQYPEDRPSPKNRVAEKDIRVYTDRIIINVDSPKWAKFTPTHSMDPLFDTEAHALQIVPKSEDELKIGDIISYQTSSGTVIHRIISIGNDEQGWYAITKGDNNPVQDPEKVRFSQIKKVLIGIIY